jgi:hypothetical protein
MFVNGMAGSPADARTEDVAEPLPGLSLEPHQLHLRNGGKVGGGGADLDARQEAIQFETAVARLLAGKGDEPDDRGIVHLGFPSRRLLTALAR